MSKIVERGKQEAYFMHFDDRQGENASISGTPTIEIYSADASGVVIYLPASGMTQLNETTYYYRYAFGNNTPLGQYIAKYRATYTDGTSVVATEDFTVVDRKFLKGSRGGGMLSVRSDSVDIDLKPVLDRIDEVASIVSSIADKRFDEKPDSVTPVIHSISRDILAIRNDLSVSNKIEEAGREREVLSRLENSLLDLHEELGSGVELEGLNDLVSLVETLNAGLEDTKKMFIEHVRKDDELYELTCKLYVRGLTDEELGRLYNEYRHAKGS